MGKGEMGTFVRGRQVTKKLVINNVQLLAIGITFIVASFYREAS